jgi:3-oxoacyl-[acyl-carrier protein] reductase
MPRRSLQGNFNKIMNDTDFSGQTVLVVGGSSGVGNGIARAFQERGATVHVWGTRANSKDYEGEEGSDLSGLHFARVDVTRAEALDAYRPPFPKLDVLVLSQGIVAYRREEFNRVGWDRVMSVNLDSVMACAMKFKPYLTQSRGSIIIISSVSAFRSNKGNPAYAASKAGLVNLTRSLGEAWAPEGIRVNGIAPGLVDTKLTKVTTENPQRLAQTLARIPLGRVAQPSEMGGAALFFASQLASYVVGQTLIVDGGISNA